MTVKTYMRILVIVIMGKIFLPLVFENLNYPFLGYYALLSLWFVSLVILKPIVLTAKPLLAIYIYMAIYVLMHLLGLYSIGLRWLNIIPLPVLSAVSMLLYFQYSKDLVGIKIVSTAVLIFIAITSLSSVIGLARYPMAARSLAGGQGSASIDAYYQRIGIGNYGFYSGLIFYIPLLVGIVKNQNTSKFIRTLMFLAITLITFANLSSTFTAQILVFVFTFVFALIGSQKMLKTRLFFMLLLIGLIVAPAHWKASFFYKGADVFSTEQVRVRLNAIGDAVQYGVDLDSPQTEAESRLARAPLAYQYFTISPMWGSKIVDPSVGHLFWLNLIAVYGIIGFLPLIYLFLVNFKYVYQIIPDYYRYYYILSIASFIALGMMKNMEGKEMMFIMFFAVPITPFIINLNSKPINTCR